MTVGNTSTQDNVTPGLLSNEHTNLTSTPNGNTPEREEKSLEFPICYKPIRGMFFWGIFGGTFSILIATTVLTAALAYSEIWAVVVVAFINVACMILLLCVMPTGFKLYRDRLVVNCGFIFKMTTKYCDIIDVGYADELVVPYSALKLRTSMESVVIYRGNQHCMDLVISPENRMDFVSKLRHFLSPSSVMV
eukprot:TRINITY_DN443_c0_g1_i1.p1 TRINITY_DN443_c0_g1~~TRINITY_DN443_c0_g1_i1.p1  ORF type:complete len:208 (-),score=56.38 TRINITY_DN443_c0_g1_i1:39-614(-)